MHEEQKKLLAEKGGDYQKEFLDAALDNDKFCELIKGWGFIEGETPKVPETTWSDNELLNPTYQTEEIIAETWADLKFREAARPGTWFSIHVEMIERGKIEKSSHFAGSTNGTKESGHDRIQKALKSKANSPKEVDDRVRDVLRRMGGVTLRGARTTYENCPTARTWWCHQYAKEAQRLFSDSTQDVENLSNTLKKASGFWAVLITSMTSSLTVIGEPGIRSSLIQFRNSLEDGGVNSELDSDQIKNLIRRVGRRAVVQALGALEPQQVLQIIRDEIAPQIPPKKKKQLNK
ncbi:MAG: hypothetical protein ISN29_10015 [Gammaproteobacteria bacterium AqS3]|nr:hypothetical protein [Gammaproteobacteria bacterium AqS3]